MDESGKPVKRYMVLTHVPDTPFIVAAVVNTDQFFKHIHQKIAMSQDIAIEQGRNSIQGAARSYLHNARLVATGGILFIMILAGGFALFFSNTISRPIQNLRNAVDQIGRGDFQTKVAESGPVEVKQLAANFNKLGSQLTEYVDNLAEAVSARQKIESELTIAEEIQRSLLPPNFSPFPEPTNFDIFAFMKPARHVGGDFYNFFKMDDERLCVAVGDVCGKGVPAAILMAVTKSIIESTATGKVTAAELLRQVNFRLAQNNEKCVFVTIFCGILDVVSGELQYANAGHDAPILVRNGTAESIHVPSGPVAGLFPDEIYHTERLVLSPGDTLLVFTDGVTEAIAKNQNFFTKERLLNVIAYGTAVSAKEHVEAIYREVSDFCEGAEQSDDITILGVKIRQQI